MSRYILLILSMVFLIASIKTSGQVIIAKNNSITLGQDSIVNIVLPDAKGNIKWQKSPDSKN